jgi:putative ABC transport system substrate-binding protein
VPKARSIAVLWNANDQGMVLRYQGIAKAAQSMGLEVRAFGLRTPASFDEAFASMTARQPDALVLVHDVLTLMNRQQVLSFAAKHRIPAMYETGNYVIGGGLMSYGPDPDDGFRVAARFVDSLIKGRKPADLPAEQPTRLELFVNVKTAKAIGVAIPQTVLVRADRVIE